MKNLDERSRPRLLGQLLAELQDSGAAADLSGKIDRAFRSFEISTAGIASHHEFNDAIAGLVRHLYQYGLLIPRTLTHRSALSEAVDLLDEYYESSGIRGFDAALLDATDTDGKGPEFVLRQLSEFIQEREVRRYSNCQFYSVVDPTDRDMHRWIVEGLIEEQGPLLPDDLRTGNPARFAKYYRELLELVITSNAFFTQIRSSSKTFPNA